MATTSARGQYWKNLEPMEEFLPVFDNMWRKSLSKNGLG